MQCPLCGDQLTRTGMIISIINFTDDGIDNIGPCVKWKCENPKCASNASNNTLGGVYEPKKSKPRNGVIPKDSSSNDSSRSS